MDRKISIEDGYHIVFIFLGKFWWDFLKNVMVEKRLINSKLMTPQELKNASSEDKMKNELHDAYHFLFIRVAGSLMGVDDDFEKIIENRIKIPASQQHDGLVIKEEMLFQLAIDFCKYYEKKSQEYGNDYAKQRSRAYGIKWLEDMKKHPEAHKTEWEIWNQVVVDVVEKGKRASGFF
ncbi:MAG: hypothetical protein KDK96_02600 [Chlamydiia bacterium]|nr:hypothetical protein [Chlamydiia bacterium]